MKEQINDFLLDQIEDLDPQKRKRLIIDLAEIPEHEKSIADSILLNNLVLYESEPILAERGQFYPVKPDKIDRRTHNIGYCYANSGTNMGEDYGYVEGYCISKKDGKRFGHAWNVDQNGNHFDFTIPNPEDYRYRGIIIPNKVVYKVGLNNGGIWYAVLPFIDEVDLN